MFEDSTVATTAHWWCHHRRWGSEDGQLHPTTSKSSDVEEAKADYVDSNAIPSGFTTHLLFAIYDSVAIEASISGISVPS